MTVSQSSILVNNFPISQKTELQTLVSQFKDVFSEQPGWTFVIHYDIVRPSGAIVRQWPYWVLEARQLAIEVKVKKMLKLGVFEPSRNLWSSSMMMFPWPDGTRFDNDFRKLNKTSSFDGYPMPWVDEHLDQLGSDHFISTLNLTKVYWQVPLTPRTKEKTVKALPGPGTAQSSSHFSTNNGHATQTHQEYTVLGGTSYPSAEGAPGVMVGWSHS